MPDAKLLPRLIERLLALTDEGKIEWAETASEEDFQAPVGQYVVTVSRESPWSNQYKIRVADLRGNLIDEASNAELSSGPVAMNVLAPVPSLVRLHEAARRRARNADVALTELLSSLESLGR
jgi:hypothetical protein